MVEAAAEKVDTREAADLEAATGEAAVMKGAGGEAAAMKAAGEATLESVVDLDPFKTPIKRKVRKSGFSRND